jgi:ribose 5-phosphate isomerase A
LGERIREDLQIRGIPTSRQTEALAISLSIPLISFADVDELDLTIDGADAIDPQLNLMKGGGGALLREKIVATAPKRLVVVADASKVVPTLGARPLPVEIIAFEYQVTMRRMRALGSVPVLRRIDGQPFLSDNGNQIEDYRRARSSVSPVILIFFRSPMRDSRYCPISFRRSTRRRAPLPAPSATFSFS